MRKEFLSTLCTEWAIHKYLLTEQLFALVLFTPSTEPETQIHIQVVYLRDDTRKRGNGDSQGAEKGRESKVCYWASYHWNRSFILGGNLDMCFTIMPPHRWESWSMNSFPVSHWLTALPGGHYFSCILSLPHGSQEGLTIRENPQVKKSGCWQSEIKWGCKRPKGLGQVPTASATKLEKYSMIHYTCEYAHTHTPSHACIHTTEHIPQLPISLHRKWGRIAP